MIYKELKILKEYLDNLFYSSKISPVITVGLNRFNEQYILVKIKDYKLLITSIEEIKYNFPSVINSLRSRIRYNPPQRSIKIKYICRTEKL